jgi:hypothetical protein
VARRGIFSRIRDLFRRATEPTEPPEQPPGGPDTPPGGFDDKERAFRQAWIEETLERPGRRYRTVRRFFDELPLMYEDEQEEYDTWRSFCGNMVAKGGIRRNDIHNPFWQETGLNPRRDFDWDGFRRAMGYKARGR